VKKPKATWIRPEVGAEIEYSGVTDDGILREAVFKGLRDDLGPANGHRVVADGAHKGQRGRGQRDRRPKRKPREGGSSALEAADRASARGTSPTGRKFLPKFTFRQCSRVGRGGPRRNAYSLC
jgi:hypothetical protein